MKKFFLIVAFMATNIFGKTTFTIKNNKGSKLVLRVNIQGSSKKFCLQSFEIMNIEIEPNSTCEIPVKYTNSQIHIWQGGRKLVTYNTSKDSKFVIENNGAFGTVSRFSPAA